MMLRALARGIAAGLALVAVACTAAPEATTYQQGKQYDLVPEQSPPPDAQKVLVQEFFWYACPHCYDLEPYLDKWLKEKPAYVSFERVPNALGRPVGALHERAYYIAEVLGIEDRIHKPLMDGLHNGDNALYTAEGIRALFVRDGGITSSDFDGVAKSFAVDGQVRRADQLAMSYGVLSTPTVVVGGKYITDVGKAGGFDGFVKLLDYLTDKVREERKLPKH